MSMETSKSSGLLAADAAVIARPAKVTAITLIPAAADCSIVVYDNASAASGDVLAKMTAVANAPSSEIHFPLPVEALNGVFVDVSGAAAAYIVYYTAM